MNRINVMMNDRWYAANYDYLLSAVAIVAQRLEHYVNEQEYSSQTYLENLSHLEAIAEQMETPPTLKQLCTLFNLSSFERDMLLMGIGMAIYPNFPALCATAHRNPQMAYPTFNLGLEIFSETHWSALTPQGNLRGWHLLQVGTGTVLPLCPLQIDESILHWLMGEPFQDSYLMNFAQLRSLKKNRISLCSSHQEIAENIANIWPEKSRETFPIVQLCGLETMAKYEIAMMTGEILNYPVKVLSALRLPNQVEDFNVFKQRWQREVLFTNSILLLDCEQVNLDHSPIYSLIIELIEQINTPLIITSFERLQCPKSSVINFDVAQLTHDEQTFLWKSHLDTFAPELNGSINRLVTQFNLSATAIEGACLQVKNHLSQPEKNHNFHQLWEICRRQARPRLDNLAQRIECKAKWEDLIIPEPQRQILKEIIAHLRQRFKVYEQWGFAAQNSRGLGLSALFSGQSGTGKTMAAEVLAKELNLDLYRIDLSAVVSKYIGETEKNLRQIFDAAETGGVILLFDEADALFGKRTQVKDSHDRHANLEVSYLLQRMEVYQGLAILTTNLKDSLDSAFLRRIRFVISFPFPDEEVRTEIWKRIFPPQTPNEGLNFKKLGKLSVAGGNIRNIALNAAFLAADVGEPVMMKHILQATYSEYLKLEKSLTDTEIKGWI